MQTADNVRFRRLWELAVQGSEEAVSDLFKEFEVDFHGGGHSHDS